MHWLFLDDRPQEAAGLAAALRDEATGLEVEVYLPADARERVLSNATTPTGMLIDVELSSVPGERGSGPGFAQDVRVAQKAGNIPDFPLIRYAYSGRVERNIGLDPASDDLFDLRIEKDDTSRRVEEIRKLLRGVVAVYDGLRGSDFRSKPAWNAILGLDDEKANLWTHGALQSRVASARQAGLHVAAGAYLRTLLLADGLLIDEDLLAIKLGVDTVRSADNWGRLLDNLRTTQYSGVASQFFPRWWVHGVAAWWLDMKRSDESLVSFSAPERIEVINSVLNLSLVPLTLPRGSAGTRPWARCALSSEEQPPRSVPIDPMEAVRVRSNDDHPPWVDPMFASLGEALRARGDHRLDAKDLARLELRWAGK